jgi:threonine/homoserine/homoserine lactone efflux protein
VAIALPLVLTPGASTAVVLRNSIAGGTRAGLITAAGVNTGSLCYGVLTACGLAVALRRWPSAWTVVQAAGIVYLAWLGIHSLRRAWHVADRRTEGVNAPQRPTAWRSLYEGFVTNLLNPAIAAFYVLVVPQFVPDGAPVVAGVLVLTAVHIALAAAWHVVWAAAGGTLARVLSGGRPRRLLEATAGVALLGLAARLALG